MMPAQALWGAVQASLLVVGIFVQIVLYQTENLLSISFDDDARNIGDSIKGKVDVSIIFVADTVAEIFGKGFFLCFRHIQNHASFARGLAGLQKKIVNECVVFGRDAWPNRGVTNEMIHLFRCKMPKPVDFFLPQGCRRQYNCGWCGPIAR